ncbi:MAG: DUF5723 family protein [Bacteroidia bacterium]
MKISLRRLTLLILPLFALLKLDAQSGLQIQYQPEEITAQFYQPAFLAIHPMKSFSAGLGTAYEAGSNALTVSSLFMNDSYISESEKDNLVGQLGDNNRLHLGFTQSAIAAFEIKKQRISLSYRDYQNGYFRINNPATAGIVLYGNAPYAGQTISDENITLRNFSYRELAIGSAWQMGDLAFGVRLRALMGKYGNFTEDLNYSLFTASDGSDIRLNSSYEIFNGSGGAGLGADLGLIYQPKPTLMIQAAVRDLGFISWNGTQRVNEVNISYQGINLNQFIDTDFSSGGRLFTPDTLEKLFFPDSTAGNFRLNLAPLASLAGSWEFSSGKTVSLAFVQGLSKYSAPAPLVNLGYAHKIARPLTLGVNVYIGGMEGYGWGGFARGNFMLAEKYHASVFIAADNASGLITPQSAGGFAFQGGITFRMAPELPASATPAR